jgi:hypothetical protein
MSRDPPVTNATLPATAFTMAMFLSENRQQPLFLYRAVKI